MKRISSADSSRQIEGRFFLIFRLEKPEASTPGANEYGARTQLRIR